VKYAFIQSHRSEFKLTSMCRVLKVHSSGYYAWLHEPLSPRAKSNEVLTTKIKEFYDQSMGIYGSPRIFCDLREAGVACGENRLIVQPSMAIIKRDGSNELAP
jgi:putative transposase